MPINFQQLLTDTRDKHNALRTSPFKSEVHSEAVAHEPDLFQKGRILWSVIIKANNALYQPGRLDLFGCLIYSFDPRFDADYLDLFSIARSVIDLTQKIPDDPTLHPFAAVVSDDYAKPLNQLVPLSLSHGCKIHYEAIYIPRARLPRGYLVPGIIPIIANPSDPSQIMILPLNLWPETLIDLWTSMPAAEAPHQPPPISAHDFAAHPVTLTPAAARQLHAVIRTQSLRSASLRVTFENGAFGMDLTEEKPNPQRDFTSSSQGIPILIDANSARDLLGLQIDYLTDTRGTGFTFKKPS